MTRLILPQSTGGTQVVTKTHTLVGNNTTVNVPIFTLTSVVEVTRIWGIVTTALGSNITAAYLRLNDQTAQSDITLATGTTLSNFTAGSIIRKTAISSSAINAQNASAEKVSDASNFNFATSILVQKTAGVLTQIEFVYTTTNTPTSGVIQFFAEWRPISSDGNLIAV